MEGAGVLVHRAFGLPHVPELDPFLLLDEFMSGNPEEYLPGFPFHPHRGIETVTYVLHGKVEHRDSLGTVGTIGEGDVQWMTAGSGIIHQEMPKGDESGFLQGYQLWVNLPASDKMMNPRYRGVKEVEIPRITKESGAVVRVIAGEIKDVWGPVRDIVTNPLLLDVSLPPEVEIAHRIPVGATVVAYAVEGSAYFDEKRGPHTYEMQGGSDYPHDRDSLIGPRHAVLYNDGDQVTIQAGPKGARFLLMAGKPLDEPVAWSGPIVMNTEEELRTAFEEIRNGIFVKYGKAVSIR
ncbi:MAG: pirin family protein [Methanomicrobiales archaeon]|nr:pirin family protein [Methanomicrobiales archaeon]